MFVTVHIPGKESIKSINYEGSSAEELSISIYDQICNPTIGALRLQTASNKWVILPKDLIKQAVIEVIS